MWRYRYWCEQQLRCVNTENSWGQTFLSGAAAETFCSARPLQENKQLVFTTLILCQQITPAFFSTLQLCAWMPPNVYWRNNLSGRRSEQPEVASTQSKSMRRLMGRSRPHACWTFKIRARRFVQVLLILLLLEAEAGMCRSIALLQATGSRCLVETKQSRADLLPPCSARPGAPVSLRHMEPPQECRVCTTEGRAHAHQLTNTSRKTVDGRCSCRPAGAGGAWRQQSRAAQIWDEFCCFVWKSDVDH